MLHAINQFLVKINSLDGFLHWTIQRLSALSILFTIPLVILVDHVYFLVILFFLFVFHISVGIRTLIDDYIHDDILFLISSTFLRIIIIFLLKSIFIIFIC
uniref:Succinate:cytochrome c oxidoreductase subunit 4 n=1 Tax=Cryptomonas curvata TaxID=233186 RepID=A0A2P1G8H1_9CRYP|nr:succinate:cytochrome c oxidoreductase subunit 4 [Cryptomonas curvata]AVM81254.1 succinate:cytochrome c oxidoreductase subunit 4 [Cryptomonas curvata]